MSWRHGDFSEELLSSNLARVQEYFKDGNKSVMCEDGIERRVVEIVTSMKYPWKYVINEKDPDSKAGHFVSALSVAAKMYNQPPPSQETIKHFNRAVLVKYRQECGLKEDGSFERPPGRFRTKNGLFIPN